MSENIKKRAVELRVDGEQVFTVEAELAWDDWAGTLAVCVGVALEFKQAEAKRFRPGDVVRLVSGGRWMTVGHLRNGSVKVWSIDESGTMHEGLVPAECLERVER